MLKLVAGMLTSAALLSSAFAADWPTSRGDALRSGSTSDTLPAKLSLAWKYESSDPPQPAWPRDDRMLFDRANEVVVAGGRAYFGSSADGRVTALDTATGRERWTFFTGAPVRFAPAVWKDRMFVVSDDGYLYSLSATDGALLRRWRGGPRDEMILGNGRMVSRWPARGGPVIVDGTVYFAAGIWQSDGVYLHAVDADTGRVLWSNDEAGRIRMPQPHGGAVADSGVSVQGHLVATHDQLLVPTGRAVPAAFSRKDGSFLYYHLQANGHTGGTETVVAGGSFYNGGNSFHLATGALEGKLGAGSVASTSAGIVHGGKRSVRLLTPVEKDAVDRKGAPIKVREHRVVWTVPDVDGSVAVIAAGETIVAAGDSAVTLIDGKSHEAIWTSQVDGTPYRLAVAGNRLYVSTDRGTVYCFDGEKHDTPAIIRSQREQAAEDARIAAAAVEIVRRTGVKDGYCLDLDCGNGSLAMALARRTNLQIYAISSSADDVTAARKALTAAGLYGTRVTVHQGDPANPPYGRYFADLVVSTRSLDEGPLDISEKSPPATLRPFGGIACTGKPGSMELVRRDALAKTGTWTHQYSDLGNSCCSSDELVAGELHALWFRDVDLEMPNRHGRGPAPLFHEGRMFVEGVGALRAVDAYNGRNLWEFALPGVLKAYNAEHLSGTAVTGSNLCLADGSVYVHDKQRCYRLDEATGRKLAEFAPPTYADGRPGLWGYVACDGKLLYGSLPDSRHRVRYAYGKSDMSDQWGESMTFFALDAKTGALKWRYDAVDSIRNNTVAIAPDRVFLIDRPAAQEDRWDAVASPAKPPAVTEVKQPAGLVVALDATSGKVLWKSERDAFGTMLAYSPAHDALLMGYQSTRFKLPSEVGGRLAVFEGRTGKRLWDKKATYITRPLINDRTIYAQGGSWDLLTGEERVFVFERSYGCGQLAGSKHMLLFRSATLGYLDLTRGSGVENFGGIRPGCWINALPVGGLVLVPDASAGCQCSYQNRSWMALAGDE